MLNKPLKLMRPPMAADAQSWLVAGLLVAAGALVGCSGAERSAEAKVAAILRDPSSAQFRNVEIRKSGAACGEVNSKNGFGGYAGFRQFVVTPDGEVMIDPDDPTPVTPGQSATLDQIQAAGDAYAWIARRLEWCVNND